MAKVKYTRFGPWLRAQLHEHHLSPADFAAAMGVRRRTVYHWMAGRRLPMRAPRLVERIAAALAVPPGAVWDVIESEGVEGLVRPASRELSIAAEGRPFAVWLRGELAARGWTTGLLARRLEVDVMTARA